MLLAFLAVEARALDVTLAMGLNMRVSSAGDNGKPHRHPGHGHGHSSRSTSWSCIIA
jgi:hypothetical protein